jgi:glycosyltransferase involved in cell wall biosynthesis
MACGLPAVSFDCETGPGEVVRHEVDGLLIPPEDVTQLAAAMARLMAGADERRRFGARAKEITQRFTLDDFYSRWDAALESK